MSQSRHEESWNVYSRNGYTVHWSESKQTWRVCIGDGTGGGPLVLAPLRGFPRTPEEFDEATRSALAREGWTVLWTYADGKEGVATPGPDADPVYWAGRTVKRRGPRQWARRLTGKSPEAFQEVWKVFYNS